jgi:hypothetical protein
MRRSRHAGAGLLLASALFLAPVSHAQGAPGWAPNQTFAAGSQVLFQGVLYECRQAHTSQPGWEPQNVPALWQRPAPLPTASSAWTAQTAYAAGSHVQHEGLRYECIQGHTSLVGWEPSQTPALWRVLGPSSSRPWQFLRREPLPAGVVTQVESYDPGELACSAGLDLGASDVDDEGETYFEHIHYPAAPVVTSGPSCRVEAAFCDEEGAPVPTPTEAQLNAPAPESSVCAAIEGAGEDCPIDPATMGGTCSADDDCAPSEVCAVRCLTEACLETERRCGKQLAACQGVPAETSCDPQVYRECADPRAFGEVTVDDVLDQLEPQSVAQATIKVLNKLEAPALYPDVSMGFCRFAPHERTADQGKTKLLQLGNEQWGVFIDPTIDQDFGVNIFGLGSDKFFAHAEGGLVAGGFVYGREVNVMSVTARAEVEFCGHEIAADIKLFGDSIASIDWLENGLEPHVEWGIERNGSRSGTRAALKGECNRKLKTRNDKAQLLRQMAFTSRNVRKFYKDKEVDKDFCERTNERLGTEFDCDDPNLGSALAIPNAWAEEYNERAQGFAAFKSDSERAIEELAFSKTFKLINEDELYTRALFPEPGLSFPVGPVTIVIELSAFGGWGLAGGVTVGVDYDGSLDDLLVNVDQLHDFLAEESNVAVAARPFFRPSVNFGILAFAGAGIPGVSIGVEGKLTALDLAAPIDAGIVAARRSNVDAREAIRAGSEYAGPLFPNLDLPKSVNWRYGYTFGGALEATLMKGKLDAVARLRILWARKTFKKHIVSWKGITNKFAIAGGASYEPLVGVEDIGEAVDPIPHVPVQPLDERDWAPTSPPDFFPYELPYPQYEGREPCNAT